MDSFFRIFLGTESYKPKLHTVFFSSVFIFLKPKLCLKFSYDGHGLRADNENKKRLSGSKVRPHCKVHYEVRKQPLLPHNSIAANGCTVREH